MNAATKSGSMIMNCSLSAAPDLHDCVPASLPPSRRLAHSRRVVHEVAGARGSQQLRRSAGAARQVLGQRERLVDQIARMAAAQRQMPRARGSLRAGPRPAGRSNANVAFAAAVLEDLLEVRRASGSRRTPCSGCGAGTPRRRAPTGLMLVAKTTSTTNGTSNFCPVCSVRKSTRLSSGTIQRFSRSRAASTAGGRSRRSPARRRWPSACTGALVEAGVGL